VILKATAVIAIALLAGACVADAGSEAPRSPAGTNADLRHVVVDTDLAFDDIMALLYLLQRDDVAIDAVTITGTGEAHCDPGVRNALALLALGGAPDTPVACGRETPLQGTNAFPDEWRAVVNDLWMVDLPAVERGADPRGAVRLLLDTLDGDTTLITLGPLTNVAEALRDDPELGSRVPEFVAMAGAIDVAGNTPNGVAEFNVWVDPLAAKEVIEGMEVTLVPLDATDDVPFTPFFAETLAAHPTSPEAKAASAIIAANQEIFLEGGYSFWDTLATALVFRPELATWDSTPVVVTASEDSGAGWIDRWDEGAPVRFATAVPDPLAFEREYLSVLTGQTITRVRPDPTITISFDGDRCTISPRRLSAGEEGRRLRHRARYRRWVRCIAPAQWRAHVRGPARSPRPGRVDPTRGHPATEGSRGTRVRCTAGRGNDERTGGRGSVRDRRRWSNAGPPVAHPAHRGRAVAG